MADFSGMIKAIKDWAVSRFLTEIPVGSTTNVGGVKADGTTTTIDSDGTIHASGGGGGTGTTDYNELGNKPSIGGVTLSGNRTLAELGIQPIGSYVTDSEMKDYAQPKGEYLTGETDPTVPAWAKEASKPTYTANEVGADAAGSASAALSAAKAYTDDKVPTKTSQLENDSGFLSSATALDSYEEIMANTASGKFAGALGVKEGLNMLNDRLSGVFSYEERVIGKFLDGKTLYEKTVTFPTNTSNNRTTYNHGIANVDSIFINTSKSFTKYSDTFGVFPNVAYVGLGYSIGGSVNNTSIIIDKGNDVKTVPHTFYITLNYTKK